MERMETEEIEEVQIIEEYETEDEEGAFVVEKILDSREGNRGTEYFLKWHGFPETENSWEPVEHLNCPDLISEFERTRKTKEAKTQRRRKRRGETSSRSLDDSEDERNKKTPKRKSRKTQIVHHDLINLEDFKTCGFERGLSPDKIIGVAEDVQYDKGDIKFLITWKGCDEADLVSSRLVRARHPKLVIEFYEKMMAQ